MNYKVVAEHVLQDIRLSIVMKDELIGRIEMALIEAAARGRRLARVRMSTRRTIKRILDKNG